MIPFYCIHHKPAVDRKEYLNKFFEDHELDVEWIESFLPSSEEVRNQPPVFSSHSANGSFLNNAEISCFLKHKQALQKIANSGESGIIIEDDIEIPTFPFNKTIGFFIGEFKRQNVDIGFIGSFSGADIVYSEPIVVVNGGFKSRCAHCYFVTAECAEKLVDFCSQIVAPFDWQLNYAIEKLSLRTAWTFPHVNQRTEKGYIKSLLR